MTRCPYGARLPQFLDGQLGDEESREIERHVQTCPWCPDELERLTAPDARDLPLPPVSLGDATAPHLAADVNGELPAVPGYRLLGVLGCGGRGIVYLADDARLRRRVALKMIRAGSGAGPRDLARFRIEMEAHARVQHPNIIPIYQIDDCQDGPFFAMEYVAGGALKEWLKEGLPPPRDAARLAETLARAMHYAHQRGVLHRDLKPANVLLQDAAPQDTKGHEDQRTERQVPKGARPASPPPVPSSRAWSASTPKITDFGLAKFLDAETEQTGLTLPHEVLGSASYMAPEQAAGKVSEVGTLTDVYGLGTVLYEMLTGHAPFEGASDRETIRKVESDQELPPPPRRWRPEVPADLELICLKCLEKEPARRYASAEQLADELGRFLRGEPLAHTRRVGPAERLGRWCRRNPALAMATGLAAAAVVAVSLVSVLWAVRESNHVRDLGEALDRAEYRLAENHLDRGVVLCERGDIGAGLLWLARSLEKAPASAEGLQSTIRTQLAGWARHVIPLKACLASPAPVTAAALSPEGRTVWAAGRDRRLYRWDVASQKQLGPPTQLAATVRAITWGPRGKVLTVCSDGTAQLWDAGTARPVGPPLRDKVTSAAWDPGGRYLVTGGEDGGVRFWSAEGGESDRPGFRQTGKVKVLTVSPDGGQIVTGEVGDVRLWDAGRGRVVGEVMRHPREVLAAAFGPDGQALLTSCADRTIRRWDAATGKPAGDPVLHKGSVQAMAVSPDGQTFVTGSRDRTARVWWATANQVVGQPLPHDVAVHTVQFSGDGRMLLTAGEETTVRVWETVFDRSLGLVLKHGAPVQAVGSLPPHGGVFTAGLDGAVRFWSAATGKAMDERVTSPRDPITAVTLSRDGRWVLARCFSPTVWLWERKAPHGAGFHLDHPKEAGWVNCAALSPAGTIVVTGCHDGSVRFWEPRAVTPWREVRAHDGPVLAAAISPDGRTAATGGGDGNVWLWDVARGTRRGPLRHGGAVLSLAFGTGGQTLLTASEDHAARLWDVPSGKQLEPDLQHGGAVRAAAISGDGRTILTASADGTARLWDAVTRKPLGGPLVHHDAVVAVAFSAEGKTALTGSWDGTARIWDVTTGKSLGPPLAHAKAVEAVAFSADGNAVLTGSADGAARLWEVPPPAQELPERIAQKLETLTGLSLDGIDTLRVLDAVAWAERRRQFENPESVWLVSGDRGKVGASSADAPQ
jgi:WD40 repeat protein/serine/threonine protein kinase